MKLATRRWRMPLLVISVLVLTGLIVPAASAAPGAVVGKITVSTPLAGTTKSYSFELQPTSGQVGSFNLNAAAGWNIISVDSAPTGVSLFSPTQIRGRSLNVSSSSPLVMSFTAQAPCASSAPTWGLVARSGGGFTGNTFAIDGTSMLSTPITDSCSAVFVPEQGPADAAFNDGTTSENITTLRFTPGGPAMLVEVRDAATRLRPGIQITLAICTPTPGECEPTTTGASIGGAVEAESDAEGIATFDGSDDPITIDQIGIRYRLEPTAAGVLGTLSNEFGIYQEGEPCSAGNSCEVHGRATNVSATISAPPTGGGALGGFVTAQPLISCPGYAHLTSETIVWVYTGTDTQTVTALLSRQVIPNRGASHIDICYLADPHPITGDRKTFVDKFGVVTSGPALLPDCTPAITTNCIVSQNATPGGGRRVIFVVEDGKGRP